VIPASSAWWDEWAWGGDLRVADKGDNWRVISRLRGMREVNRLLLLLDEGINMF